MLEKDYKTLYLNALQKAEYALKNVSDGLSHITTGNVSHNIIGAKCNTNEWAKFF